MLNTTYAIKIFNKWELRQLNRALYTAINSEEALIDAYRGTYHKRSKTPKLVLNKEDRNVIAMLKRNIAAWEKLQNKINLLIKGGK